ncbi:energy-coupling factor transport system ATP-binding protein [Marinactinospora thermotolerans DSM 45154]|uniref:Energy-coupling factor transport system ATP-binding protein n=1 Tax=Marinactinospora thermotolerans DSM 45154 TaxID=1122192 RepID=A0A1T4SE96_9ACTN|nr:ABC transporter ATP-binding protein [Marinactinospora thermotolerans]SKA26553.1 energy-coupling factor transport system ATP-binding protein [Marinactinospora thermotolerans DSM 45154]
MPDPSQGARVELAGWGWRHSGRREWALRGVDLTIEPGERVLLLGASGAGKSTLLHAMAGLTGPERAIDGEQEGSLLVDGEPAAARRGGTGLVAQDPETQLVMARAGDDVAFGPENLGVAREEIWRRVDTALREVGFPYGPQRSTAALSGGEKQRLVVAGALAMRPRLLLLDEPTANLDPEGAWVVRGLVARLAETRGATLVLVEHRVAEVTDLVDRVVVVEPGGGVVADGPPHEVFTRHGADLAARGVWVPGHEPRVALPAAPAGETLLEAVACVLRTPPEPGLGGAGPRTVLESVNETVRSAGATALTGPNGAGKSTLLAALAGLAAPHSGEVRPRGPLAAEDTRPLHRWPARRLARRIGTVFQHAEDQFVTTTVRDELRFAPLRAGMRRAEADVWVTELMERLRLAPLADEHPFTLSGGEKRRLSVATALSSGPAHAPDVLVLDEPTFGQDTRTWRELVELLADLRAQGRAIVMATHDELLLRTLADVELRVGGGRVHRAAPHAREEAR